MSKRLIFIILYCLIQTSQAQEISVKGEFLKDSTVIGEVIPYALSVRSPQETELFLPDSSGEFNGLQFHELVWFESQREKEYILDSVVYYLSTFDIDPIQTFNLSFYTWDGKDSTLHQSTSDTIYLQYVVTQIPDSLSDIKLQQTTDYYRVEPPFNVTIFVIGIIIALNVVAFIYLLFGKKILTWWRLRRIKSNHRDFIKKYDDLYYQLENDQDSFQKTTEKLLIHWKNYAEKLDGVPYPILTTREINEITSNHILFDSLKQIDKAIYAQNKLEPVKSGFEKIKELSQETYNKKVEKIRDGK